MAEFTNVAAQTVAANGNVVFSNTAVKGSNCIQHREGSGIITLRGLTNQCKARFFVDFSGNIAIPTGGTVGAISLAIAISGEPVLSSQMRCAADTMTITANAEESATAWGDTAQMTAE